SAQGQDFMRF
uniref:FMRFamide-like neuropeptide SAQGQDFMRF-amide n=1 Tax=Delia radicum TaxID=30064 RepID=FAR10_DELRA|nr:RecName: Full=FMRFamide-like neuropeptide SAQGQDFMRF-amide [Delia radicum]